MELGCWSRQNCNVADGNVVWQNDKYNSDPEGKLMNSTTRSWRMCQFAALVLCSQLPLTLAAQTASAAPASSAYFEAEDIFALEYASEPQVSPDGKTVVYIRNSNDIMTDGTHSTLWLVDVKSGR